MSSFWTSILTLFVTAFGKAFAEWARAISDSKAREDVGRLKAELDMEQRARAAQAEVDDAAHVSVSRDGLVARLRAGGL